MSGATKVWRVKPKVGGPWLVADSMVDLGQQLADMVEDVGEFVLERVEMTDAELAEMGSSMAGSFTPALSVGDWPIGPTTSAIDRAVILHTKANQTSDPELWDIAGDAWEDYGDTTEAAFCHSKAGALRRGVPSMLGPVHRVGTGDERSSGR